MINNKYLTLNCLETALTEAVVAGNQPQYITELEKAIAILEDELGVAVKSVVDYDYPERARIAA
jgi:transcriptional regulatory protein LevR